MEFKAETTGARIKELRDNQKMKQADLAAVLHVSRNYVGMIEKGERIPGVSIYVAIADYFDVTLDYLLTGRSNEVLRTKLRVAMDLLRQVERII